MPVSSTNGQFNPAALVMLRKSYVETGLLPAEPDMGTLINDILFP